MHFNNDIASNNCNQSDTIRHNTASYDTDNLSTPEIQELVKHLETELAYRELDAMDDDWYYDFGEDDFEADNDNDELDYSDELNRGWSVDIDHEYPGQVAAERNCIRFNSVIEELIDCEIRGVTNGYDRGGNPVAFVKYWLDGEKEARIVFKVNHGLEDTPVNVITRAI